MWRWMEMNWREEIELVKWKCAWNGDNKRAEASAHIIGAGEIDSRHQRTSSTSRFGGCCQAIIAVIFLFLCIEIIATYSNVFIVHPMICPILNVRQHTNTPSYKHMESVKLLTTSIFFASLPPSPSFITWIIALYANSTVCHEVFKNSAHLYGLFFTPFNAHDLYILHLFADIQMYMLLQSSVIHAFIQKLVYSNRNFAIEQFNLVY